MAETATVGELLVRIRADVNDLETGLNKAQTGIVSLATRTTPGINRVENAFRSLAFSVTGVPGPVGKLSTMLLNFTAGGSITLGVLAGMAAIGGALALMEYRSKRVADALKEIEENGKLKGLHGRTILGDVNDILSATSISKLETIRQKLAELRQELARQPRFGGAASLLTEKEGQALGGTVITPGVGYSVFTPEQQARIRAAIRELQKQLRDLLKPQGEAQQGLDQAMTQRGVDAFLGPWFANLEKAFRKTLDAIPRSLARHREIQQAWASFGYALGDIFLQGFEAATSGGLGGFLKSLGFTLLRGVLFGAISTATGGTFAAGFGAGTGITFPGKSNSLVAAPTGMLDFSKFPAATNPLAGARDAQWQSFFRESGLVARKLGYR